MLGVSVFYASEDKAEYIGAFVTGRSQGKECGVIGRKDYTVGFEKYRVILPLIVHT